MTGMKSCEQCSRSAANQETVDDDEYPCVAGDARRPIASCLNALFLQPSAYFLLPTRLSIQPPLTVGESRVKAGDSPQPVNAQRNRRSCG